MMWPRSHHRPLRSAVSLERGYPACSVHCAGAFPAHGGARRRAGRGPGRCHRLWRRRRGRAGSDGGPVTLTVDVFGNFGYEELYKQYEAEPPERQDRRAGHRLGPGDYTPS